MHPSVPCSAMELRREHPVGQGRTSNPGAGLRWVIAADKHGADLAVFGLPGSGDVLVYPANFVAKRWEWREADFLQKSLHEISAEVRWLTAQRRPNDRKPWWRFW